MRASTDLSAEPVRVLRILTRPNLGGPARQCVALGRVLPSLGVRQTVVAGRTEPGETELAEASAFVRVAELRRGFAPRSDVAAVAAIERVARSVEPHLVHTHMAKAGSLGAVVARRLGVPLVHTYHGHVLRDYFRRPVSWLFKRIERKLNRERRAHVFCVSASCAAELQELRVLAPGSFEVVPPALELDPPAGRRAAIRSELGLPEDAPAVAWCGRLVPIKDPSLLARTAAQLAPEGVVVCAFGSGGARPETDAVRWFGARPDFPRLVEAFDALLMTSRREGLPLAALEALAKRVPVVGPRVPGLVDLEGPGVTLTDRDPAALARACRDAGAVPAAAAAAVIERHDPTRVARRYVQAYEEVLGRVTGDARAALRE